MLGLRWCLLTHHVSLVTSVDVGNEQFTSHKGVQRKEYMLLIDCVVVAAVGSRYRLLLVQRSNVQAQSTGLPVT